ESDRLAATADMLRLNGVEAEIAGDDLIVHGRGRVPGGGTVVTHMDHRIAMSALVMGLASEKPIGVDDAAFIATSFPGFPALMGSLGADLSGSLRSTARPPPARERSASGLLPISASDTSIPG